MIKEEVTELLNDFHAKYEAEQEEMTKRLDDQETRFGKLDEIEENLKYKPDSHSLEDTTGIQFHLQCVVAIAFSYSLSSTRWERCRRWIMGVSSLALVILQFILLYFLILESSRSTCVSNMDCNVGEFCSTSNSMRLVRNTRLTGSNSVQPRCTDCAVSDASYEMDDYKSCKEEYGFLKEDVIVWISGDGIYHPELDDRGIYCFNALHCIETNIGFKGAESGFDDQYTDGHCDYLELNANKLTWSHILIFIFSAMLLGSTLQLDINQCITEEKLFDYALEKENVQGNPLVVEIVRYAFRLRKFVLPWVVAAATATLMVVNSMSVKNILLNLLAIGFITEADNLLGKLFTTKTQKDLVNEFLHNVKQDEDISFKVSFMWSRFLAILPVMVMTVAVICMRNLILIFERDIACDDVEWWTGYVFFYYFPFLIITGESAVFFRRNKMKSSNLLQRIISCMQRVSRNYNAVFGIVFMWAILQHRLATNIGFYSGVVVFNSIFVYLSLRPFDNAYAWAFWALSFTYFLCLVLVGFFEFIPIFETPHELYDDYYDDEYY